MRIVIIVNIVIEKITNFLLYGNALSCEGE